MVTGSPATDSPGDLRLGRQERFRKAGFEVFAVPADFHSGWGDGYLLEKWQPSAKNLVDSDTALYEWLGIAIYRLRGWM